MNIWDVFFFLPYEKNPCFTEAVKRS